MKLSHIFLLNLVIFWSCTNDSADQASINQKIAEVETNLIAPVYFEGDSSWTIEERMEHYGVPGVSLAVIHNGELAWSKTYGVTDKELKSPVTGRTLFQAASISKPVSAYAALRLVEQGKIDMNVDINSQLKSWKLAENEFTRDKKVTLKQLVNHSAGTTVHGFLGYSPDLPVPTLLEVLNGEPPANSNPIVVDKTPEESFRYSGGGYNIVQQLMIDTEGKTFPEILKEQVLDPLDMLNSSFNQPLDSTQLQYAATGYLPDGSMTKGKRHTYPEMAAAGLWTNAEDLAKFAINIQKTLAGDTIKALSKESTIAMLTPYVEDNVGLGIFLSNKKDEIYFGHGGWNEGFSSDLVAHKDKGYGAVIMINSNHPEFIDELMRSVALSYNWDNYFPHYNKLDKPGEINSKLIGKYLVRDYDFIELKEENGQLIYKDGPEFDFTDFVKVSDSTFAVRDFNVLFQFKENADQDTFSMHILNPNTMETRSVYHQVNSNETLPLEILMKGDFDQTLKRFEALKEADEKHPAVNENNLNNLGYRFMRQDKNQFAKEIFKLNMMLYPKSYNVYDSYAEACMVLGEDELAIEYYQKSLDLNPENRHANHQIEKIKEGQ